MMKFIDVKKLNVKNRYSNNINWFMQGFFNYKTYAEKVMNNKFQPNLILFNPFGKRDILVMLMMQVFDFRITGVEIARIT